MDRQVQEKRIQCSEVIGKILYKEMYRQKNKSHILMSLNLTITLQELFRDQFIQFLSSIKHVKISIRYFAPSCKYIIKRFMICSKYFYYYLGFLDSKTVEYSLIES